MATDVTWASAVLNALQKLSDTPSATWDQATSYATLPAASTCAGATWLVLDGTGIWPANKPSGWYYSDGIDWAYLGSYNPVVTGGNVVVANFPSSYPVTGPLTDSQLRASPVPVSGDFSLAGSVAVSNFPATQPVSGVFWQATQPISVASLPLPSGASTEVTLALIKAKTDNIDVLLSTRTKPADTQTISGAVSVSNLPSTQPVSGTFWQSTQPVSGPLTDAQLRASAVPVSGTFWQTTQPVSGSVSVSNLPATQPVSGTFWQSTQPVSAASLPLPSGASTEATLALIKAKTDNLDVLLSTRTKPADTQVVSGSVSVSNFPATQPVSGTFWQATQPVSGPLTDTQLRASAVPVSGTFWQATQPVSGPLTDTQLRASAVPVSGTFFQVTQPVSGTVTATGPLTDTQLRASAVPVSGTFFQATQPVSGTVTVTQGTLTKATQGSTGVSTQDLKDAGRSYLAFTANAIAGVTTEALVSFNQSKQGTNTASVTSYTITTGKTLRVTSISISLKSAAAAIAFSKVILRHNTAGATTASSPIAYLCPEINTNSATSGTGASITIPIPDGVEFFGNGTQTIGVSHLDQATTNVLNITVYGFEY